MYSSASDFLHRRIVGKARGGTRCRDGRRCRQPWRVRSIRLSACAGWPLRRRESRKSLRRGPGRHDESRLRYCTPRHRAGLTLPLRSTLRRQAETRPTFFSSREFRALPIRRRPAFLRGGARSSPARAPAAILVGGRLRWDEVVRLREFLDQQVLPHHPALLRREHVTARRLGRPATLKRAA